MYFTIACLEEPFRSFKATIAAAIISIYFGWSAGLADDLALEAFFAAGDSLIFAVIVFL